MILFLGENPISTVADESSSRQSSAPAERLRSTMAAVRVSFRWLGIRKSLTSDQKSVAADVFGAKGSFLSVGKKLLAIPPSRHPAFKAVTAVRDWVVSHLKSVPLPYPEPGVRLIGQDRINQFDIQLREYREELDEAVQKLDDHYAEPRQAARERLGTLYDPSNYPVSLAAGPPTFVSWTVRLNQVAANRVELRRPMFTPIWSR